MPNEVPPSSRLLLLLPQPFLAQEIRHGGQLPLPLLLRLIRAAIVTNTAIVDDDAHPAPAGTRPSVSPPPRIVLHCRDHGGGIGEHGIQSGDPFRIVVDLVVR